MKIVVLGTRGIPNIQGGVETHCEELYPRIAAMGHEVTVMRRKPYVSENNKISEYRGVKLIDVYAPRKKSFEAIVHSFLALCKAKRLKPDVVHVHAIGPALVVPFARLLGLKVVMTNHGPDYDRQKWGRMAKAVLRAGERSGSVFSNRVIVISKVIESILAYKYGRRDTALIFNGVNRPEKTVSRENLRRFGIDDDTRYVLAVGRFVKEKGFHDLIRAYVKSGISKTHRLVIAGDSDHEDEYSVELKQLAHDNGVILTGFIKGEPLNELFSGASLFVLPSYHEGLPIVLLEAMSYGLDVLVSDIPANRLDVLSHDDFFMTGDVACLASAMERKLSAGQTNRQYDLSAYDWDEIARQTVEVYKSLV